MIQICKFCSGPLDETRVEGRPLESSLHCRNKGCGHEWVDQNPRLSGSGTIQISFGADEINRLQVGRPSQGEDNCRPICATVLAWLGGSFAVGQPCPEPGARRDSANERGYDFSLRSPCGHGVEIQVTRVVEQAHYAALGRGQPVLDNRAHGKLIALVEETVRKKTDRTPLADRSKRILAIDGRDPSVALNLFLANVRFVDMSEVFGWGGVLLVVDERNTRFLDRETWPDCHLCSPMDTSLRSC